jgi:hypothetical protein
MKGHLLKLARLALKQKVLLQLDPEREALAKVQSPYHLQSAWHELEAKSVFLTRMSMDQAFLTLLGWRDVRQSKRDELFRHNSTQANLIRHYQRD